MLFIFPVPQPEAYEKKLCSAVPKTLPLWIQRRSEIRQRIVTCEPIATRAFSCKQRCFSNFKLLFVEHSPGKFTILCKSLLLSTFLFFLVPYASLFLKPMLTNFGTDFPSSAPVMRFWAFLSAFSHEVLQSHFSRVFLSHAEFPCNKMNVCSWAATLYVENFSPTPHQPCTTEVAFRVRSCRLALSLRNSCEFKFVRSCYM